MQYIKQIISSDPVKSNLYDTILERDRIYWRKFKSPDEIIMWLRNFNGDNEIYLALKLASNILYYTLDEIRALWNTILMNRVKLFILKEIFGDNDYPDIKSWYPEYMRSKCIFVGYGQAAKSGPHFIYDVKKSTDLKLNFYEFKEFLNISDNELNDVERIFLVDDFIGSGNQAKDNWYKKFDEKSINDIYQRNPHLNFIYLALVGFNEGKELIEKLTPLEVILGEEIDDRFKCFSDVSSIYENAIERSEAKEIMKDKGKLLYEHPLGYDNLELAIAFHHNTPNNSLPVIWKHMDDGTWHALFRRCE